MSQSFNQANSFNSLTLFQKNEEYKYKVSSLEKKLQSVTSDLKQNENWKERFNEQKNQIIQLNQKIEDLQTRLQISLQSQSEQEKKHQEAIEQLNAQRLSEIIHMKTIFSKKENQQNEIITNLREKNKLLKSEISNHKQKINEIEKKAITDIEQAKEQTPVPFSIQIPTNENELKWKKRYKKEKEKKKQLQSLQIEQQNVIENKEQEIENLKKEIEEKQHIINSLQIQQNETSTIIQSLQQKFDDYQIQHSISIQESQNKIREQSNNNMEIELASFLTEQNEIHNKKINSLSIKLSKVIQINNELNEKNEKFLYVINEKNKKIDSIQNQFNIALIENKQKDKIINKILKKIKSIQSKNKILKKENFEFQQSFSQQNSSQIQNDSQFIDKFFSLIDSHKNEINMMRPNIPSIPINLLPRELLSSMPENYLKIEKVIEWYNNEVKSLKIEVKQLKIVKNVISSCFTQIQFDLDDNKLFCEQVRNAINALKDQLRVLKLKHQQLHVNSLNVDQSENNK